MPLRPIHYTCLAELGGFCCTGESGKPWEERCFRDYRKCKLARVFGIEKRVRYSKCNWRRVAFCHTVVQEPGPRKLGLCYASPGACERSREALPGYDRLLLESVTTSGCVKVEPHHGVSFEDPATSTGVE